MPTSSANAKFFKLAPPSASSATSVMTTVASVLNERVIVCLIDSLTILSYGLPGHDLGVLADPVENDDRIHDRVADDRQHGGQERVVGAPAGERVDADHHQRVANERDDRDEAEDVVPAEAERDVDELDADRDDQRQQRVDQVFASERGTDGGDLRLRAIDRRDGAERVPQRASSRCRTRSASESTKPFAVRARRS